MSPIFNRFLLAIAVFLTSASVWARPEGSELHVRGGYFTAKYTGPIENDVSIPGAFDIDYSTFISNTTAVNFRVMAVIEFPQIKNHYNYAGVGLRYFTAGPAYPVNAEEDGFSFVARPALRTYFGVELGMAQATVVSYGNVLQTSSSLFVAHFNLGATYTLTPKVGLSGQVTLGAGSGYTAVSVGAMNAMALLGLCFFF